MHAGYIEHNEAKEVFLSTLPLENAIAHGNFEAIKSDLEKTSKLSYCLPFDLLADIETDGVAILAGVENGLVSQMHENSRYLISIHCTERKINWNVLCANVNAKFLVQINSILGSLYKPHQHPLSRMQDLKMMITKILENQPLKFQYLNSVTQVISKGNVSGKSLAICHHTPRHFCQEILLLHRATLERIQICC